MMGNRDERLSSTVLAPDLLDGGPETEPLNDVTSFPSLSAQISELQVPAAATTWENSPSGHADKPLDNQKPQVLSLLLPN